MLQDNRFVKLYNTEFMHSGIKFVTPHQRHYGLDEDILRKRTEVYEEARSKNPARWTKGIRDWSRINQVALNPTKEIGDNLLENMRQLS